MREVTNRILDWLDKFKEIGNLVSSFDPIHSALPWAGIRFILQVAVSENAELESLLVGLEHIFNVMARCEVYERLYLSANLQSSIQAKGIEKAMVELYAAVLIFLARAKRFYEKKTISEYLC